MSSSIPRPGNSLVKEDGSFISINVDELIDIESDELVHIKRSLLAQFKTTKFEWKEWQTSLLLPALRVYHFNEREMNAHKAYCLYSSLPFSERMAQLGPVSPRNENRSLIYIWKRLFASQNAMSSDQVLDIKSQLRKSMKKLSSYVYHYYDSPRNATFLNLFANSCFSVFSAFPSYFNPTQTILNDDISNKFHQYVDAMRFNEVNASLRLAKQGDIRGLITTTGVEAEAPLLRLPVECIMSYHSLANSPLKVLYDVEGLPNDVSLALFLIFEFYNDDSPWRAYLDMLPMEFDTALYFTESELLEIAGTTISEEILSLQEKTRHVYQAVVPVLIASYPHLFRERLFTLENFIWAQSVIDSRGIRLNLNGEAFLCLLPLVDAINGTMVSFLEGSTSISLDLQKQNSSSEIEMCESAPPQGDAYTIRTLVPLEKGEQVLMNYGAFSNRELLLYYGYVEVNGVNVYDTFSFDLDVDDGPTGELQSQLLLRLGLELDQHISFDGSVHDATLMALQLLLSTEEELMYWIQQENDIELGKNLYRTAKESLETKQNLTALLSNLLEGMNNQTSSTKDSSYSTHKMSLRMENVRYYLETQKQIIQRAIDGLL